MKEADRRWGRWLVQLLSWDGALPLGCWGVIWLVHRIFLQQRGIVELTAIFLPAAAFLLRIVVGWRNFRMGAPPAWTHSGPALLRLVGEWVQFLRLVLFFLGLATLAFLDAIVALRPLLPQMAGNQEQFQVFFAVSYGIYFVCMAVVTLPPLQPAVVSGQHARRPAEPAPIATALVTAMLAERLRPADWRRWAERVYFAGKIREPWLLQVAQAQTEKELFQAALPRLVDEQSDKFLLLQAALGHLWEQYQSGELTLAEFFDRAIVLCLQQPAPLDVERLAVLADELQHSTAESVEQEIAQQMEIPSALAREYWDLLQRVADVLP